MIQEIDKLNNGAHSWGNHFRVHIFAPLWLMCDRFGNTCIQRKKLKCEIDLGSQNNLDVWSISEHIRKKNTNKFWLTKVKDKIDKTESRIEVDRYCPLMIKIEMREGYVQDHGVPKSGDVKKIRVWRCLKALQNMLWLFST